LTGQNNWDRFFATSKKSCDQDHWEDRESAGKLNDSGKNGELIAGNLAKRRKIRVYSFNYVILQKKILQSPFFLFVFSREKQTLFLSSNLRSIHPIVFREGAGSPSTKDS